MSFNGSRTEYLLPVSLFAIGFIVGARAAGQLGMPWLLSGMIGGSLCLLILKMSVLWRDRARADEEKPEQKNGDEH